MFDKESKPFVHEKFLFILCMLVFWLQQGNLLALVMKNGREVQLRCCWIQEHKAHQESFVLLCVLHLVLVLALFSIKPHSEEPPFYP